MSNQTIRIPVAFALKNFDMNIDALLILAWFLDAASASGWTTAQSLETTAEPLSNDDHHLHCTLAKYCVAPSGA